ncbi:MAG TPA: hypothetical protein VNN21_11900, partial [Dehalococcoidia bacterium]|nr:hypothetical protein [Dehalococcoidia bacterium]
MAPANHDGIATKDPIAEAIEAQAQAEEMLHASALRYGEEQPGTDVDAIEVVLAMLRAVRVHRTAIGRQIEALGLGVNMSGAR